MGIGGTILSAGLRRFSWHCGTRRELGCVQPILLALSALGTARVFNPWRHGLGMRATTSCTISWREAFGMLHHWRQPFWPKQIIWSAGTMPG